VLLECLHAAFAGPAGGFGGLAIWCFELDSGVDRASDLASSLSNSDASGGDAGGGGGGGGRSRLRGVGTSGGAVGGLWRDVMGEAVAEMLSQGPSGPVATAAAAGGGGRAGGSGRPVASAGGGPSRAQPNVRPAGRSATRGSAAAAPHLPAAEGPVYAASVVEAIAALHAAFARSSLWRRRDPVANAGAPSTPAAPAGGRSSSGGGSGGSGGGRYSKAPLLEATTPPDGSAAVQRFVRLGVRQTQAISDAPGATQIGRGSGAAVDQAGAAPTVAAARRQRGAAADSDRAAWTTLDLVFVGCDPQPPPSVPFPRAAGGRWDSDGEPRRSRPEAGPGRGGGRPQEDGGGALGPVRELLEELVARQGVDTGGWVHK
jgi:hypothetical protein